MNENRGVDVNKKETTKTAGFDKTNRLGAGRNEIEVLSPISAGR